ncbi:unnamed protein product [Parnassius apollo]|uniref:(apollo) hypothetical protein n=1 Tax=Parnassius apollo TaxID=110799 RepID=A0A8S3WS47_PARAO|nr:unnamed protein product [Parnassius apollo]
MMDRRVLPENLFPQGLGGALRCRESAARLRGEQSNALGTLAVAATNCSNSKISGAVVVDGDSGEEAWTVMAVMATRARGRRKREGVGLVRRVHVRSPARASRQNNTCCGNSGEKHSRIEPRHAPAADTATQSPQTAKRYRHSHIQNLIFAYCDFNYNGSANFNSFKY